MKNKQAKYLLIVLFIIIIITIIIYINSKHIIDITQLHNFILSFGMLAPIIFILIYIIATLFGLSAVFFTILAGTIFGLYKGWVIVIIAASLAANIAFLISRYLKSKFWTTKHNHSTSKLAKKIEENAKEHGISSIILLRMAYTPYIPLSYAAGLVKTLKMRDFAIATLITNIFGSFFFIFLGYSIFQNLTYFILAIIFMGILLIIVNKVKKTKI